MTGTRSGGRPSGLVIGSLIALSFGTVFVLENSGGLPDPWPWAVRVAGLVIAIALLVAVFRTARVARDAGVPEPPGVGFADRRFRLILVAEVVALFGGLFVINGLLDRSAVSVAWVALVVGVHFFALAWAWRMPLYHWLGAVMTALGLGGFLAYAAGASAATVALISGVGSGFALYAAVAAALRDTRRRAQHARI